MTLILWLVAAYAAICAAADFGRRLFMYFPDPTRVAPVEVGLNGVREIEIAVADGVGIQPPPYLAPLNKSACSEADIEGSKEANPDRFDFDYLVVDEAPGLAGR